MPSYKETKSLPYTAQQLYDIVADVKSYPKFLPWSAGCVVTNQKERQFDAELSIGYKLIQTSYISRVHLFPFEKIEAEYLKGPFEYLENSWAFRQLTPHSTELEFIINFCFKNSFFQKIAEHLFEDSVKLMTQAFEKRAAQLYTKAHRSKS